MNNPRQALRREWVNRLAPWMFLLSLLFLVFLAATIVLWIDVPRVVDTVDVDDMPKETEIAYQLSAFQWGQRCLIVLAILWPLFWLEYLLLWVLRDRERSFRKQHPNGLWHCLLPPTRMCSRDRETIDRIWLPKWHWQTVDRHLRQRLERVFSIPMIWIALLILPVLALQMFFKEQVVEYPLLRFALHLGAGLIWFAFTVEFLVMISVSDKKLSYCRKHWLDLVIILLPLISFLRTLRLLRATKLVKIAKLQQLAKVVRVYRLRGLAMRGFRALLILEVIHRLLRNTPEKRIIKLKEQLAERELEIEDIKREIAELEKRVIDNRRIP